MNNAVAGTATRERELIELYQELTGASESMARGVYMHVCCRKCGDEVVYGGTSAQTPPQAEPARGSPATSLKAGNGWLTGPIPVPAG